MARNRTTTVGRILIAASVASFSLGQSTAWAQNTEPQASAASPRDPVPVAAQTSRIWRVNASDHNVREILSRWSTAAGWQLSWEVPNDVELHATASFQGGFEDAVEQLLTSLQGSDYPLSACTYDNRVLRVVTSTLICDRKAQ